MTNREIAALFQELADIMEIAGENPFKIHAYRNISRTLSEMHQNIAGMPAEKVEEIPGVGKAISEKIQAAVKEGTFPTLEKWRQSGFNSLRSLLLVDGLTIRKLRAMTKELNVESAEELKKAIGDGRLDSYKGLDGRTKKRIAAHLTPN